MNEQKHLSLHRDERGSAMTEFVIMLPIYVMIFIGLGMMYRYNNEGMVARMKVIQQLSTRTSALNSWEDFIPGPGGGGSVSGFGEINFTGSNDRSMLVDSARKGSLGAQFGQIKDPAAPPSTDLAAITNPNAEIHQQSSQ